MASSTGSTSSLPMLREVLKGPVENGTPMICALQRRFRPYKLDGLMTVASFCGSQTFYTLMIPLLFWFGDVVFATNVVILMVFNFVVGNIIKNALELPRPPSPPVWRGVVLDSDEDFGMPSTHSMNAIALSSYTMLHYCYHGALFTPPPFPGWGSSETYIAHPWVHTWASSPTLIMIGVAVVLTWTATIAFSRMYLGVHSPPDVMVGLFLGTCTANAWWVVSEPLMWWMANMDNSVKLPLYCLGFIVVVLAAHPLAKHPTSSFPESIGLLGVAYGIVVGLHYMQPPQFQGPTPAFERLAELITHHTVDLLHPINQHSLAKVLDGVARMIAGFIIMFGMRVSTKAVSLTVLPPLFSAVGLWPSNIRTSAKAAIDAAAAEAKAGPPQAMGGVSSSLARASGGEMRQRKHQSAIMPGVTVEQYHQLGLAAFGGVRPDHFASPIMWSRFVTYASMSFAVSYLVPTTLQQFGMW